MKKLRRTDFVILAVILALIIGITLIVMSGGGGKGGKTSAEPTETAPKTLTVADYNGKRMGILTGSSLEPITFDKFPDSEYIYFDVAADLVTALQNNKIDGFLEDEPVLRVISNEQDDVTYLKEPVEDDNYSFGFT